MTAITGWQGGRLNTGLGWTAAFSTTELPSLPNTDSVLSNLADITNGTSLDQFADLSFSLVIASSTIAAGANFAFWLYTLNQDGSTYGDGQLVANTQAAKTPSFPPAAVFAIPAVASTTTMVGLMQGIVIPPGSFRFVVQNNCGFALTSGTQTIKYRSYNIRVDNPT